MYTKSLKGCFVLLLMGTPLITWLLMLDRGNQLRRVCDPCSTSPPLPTHAGERTSSSPNFSVTEECLDRNQLRRLSEPCSTSPPLPTHAGERTLSSLNFSGIEEYLDKLFPPCSSTAIPEFPAFLTAISSNHFKEGLFMLDHFNQTIRTRYPNVELYLFDIGLSKKEALEIRASCNCNYRIFPFDEFPNHVQILKGYAWKPIAIQLVIKEYPFVVWMDASIRFTASDFSSILTRAKLEGVLAQRTSLHLLRSTAKPTFEMLETDPWLYDGKAVFGAGFIVIRATPYVVQYIMRPWISCALKLGCMVPLERAEELVQCKTFGSIYFRCHRFDQSVLSILMHMAYREKEVKHEVCEKKNCAIKCTRCKGIHILQQFKEMYG